MDSEMKITYNVDLVMCIDCTGSMGKLIGMVKNNALAFYQDVTEKLAEKGKIIDQLRTRVVAFRDYVADGDEAMLTTDFFVLPEQSADFESCVKHLVADGGGDAPEDGLEALAYAIKSDWDRQGVKRRHIIVVWTDAPTHEIGYAADKSPSYPNGMPKSFDELTSWWGDVQNKGYIGSKEKRLVLFAPDAPGWSQISEVWDNVLHFPSKAGQGLQEVTYEAILNAIGNSI